MAFLILFLFLGFFTKAQYNLVPNPSFESYSNCPTTNNQLNYATGWINPTISTPDYFNSCSSTFGVPSYCNCSSVFQYPKTGNAYCGIWCKNSTVNSREYLQMQMNTTLQSGKCYVVSFYANIVNWAGYACNNLGAYLSPNQVNSSSSNVLLSYNSQIKKFKNEIITDTLNWVKISGVYTASGGENYITIGNFNDDVNTDTVLINGSSSLGAYYNIDDVSVTPIDSIIGGMSAKAGVDKSIAIGDSAFIGQEISNLNCNWYQLPGNVQIATNTSGIYVKPTAPATYVVEQNLCGTITYDTVFVMVSPTGIVSSSIVENNFKIYPNPTNSILNIIDSKKQLQNSTIEIKNYLGQVVFSSPFNTQINLSNLSVGLYFLTIQDKSNSKTVKIIKE
jgi:hypothetical protein